MRTMRLRERIIIALIAVAFSVVLMIALTISYPLPTRPTPRTPTSTSSTGVATTKVAPSEAGSETVGEKVCIVYFTFIGCPNCAVTDPIVLSEWPLEHKRLVVIEYVWRGGDITHPNAKTFGRYAQIYHSRPAVPQIILNETEIWLGRVEVPKAIDALASLHSNPCPLISDSKPVSRPFGELKLKELPGLPKIWANGRVLISLGNGSWVFGWNGTQVSEAGAGDRIMEESHLKRLLFAEDVAGALKGYRFDVLGGIAVFFSGSAFPRESGFIPSAYFENAVKIPLK